MRFFYLYACSRHAANDAAFAASFICQYYSIFEPRKTQKVWKVRVRAVRGLELGASS